VVVTGLSLTAVTRRRCGTAMVVIPRDQAVDVSRQILRSIWESSSHTKRIALLALLISIVLGLVVGAYQAS
jgi:ABC-type Fe3+ transport system permease subunit